MVRGRRSPASDWGSAVQSAADGPMGLTHVLVQIRRSHAAQTVNGSSRQESSPVPTTSRGSPPVRAEACHSSMSRPLVKRGRVPPNLPCQLVRRRLVLGRPSALRDPARNYIDGQGQCPRRDPLRHRYHQHAGRRGPEVIGGIEHRFLGSYGSGVLGGTLAWSARSFRREPSTQAIVRRIDPGSSSWESRYFDHWSLLVSFVEATNR